MTASLYLHRMNFMLFFAQFPLRPNTVHNSTTSTVVKTFSCHCICEPYFLRPSKIEIEQPLGILLCLPLNPESCNICDLLELLTLKLCMLKMEAIIWHEEKQIRFNVPESEQCHAKTAYFIITSRVSGRGNIIGPVCVSVCVCVCPSVCLHSHVIQAPLRYPFFIFEWIHRKRPKPFWVMSQISLSMTLIGQLLRIYVRINDNT